MKTRFFIVILLLLASCSKPRFSQVWAGDDLIFIDNQTGCILLYEERKKLISRQCVCDSQKQHRISK